MKIVLFHPRGYDNSDQKPRISDLAVMLPPLGLASIAAVLRQEGHVVEIIDAVASPMITNDIWTRKIIDLSPDIVGFSAITPSFHDAYDVCCRIKDIDNNIKTVFGGVHASWGKETLLRDYPAIDYIIAGEGEYAFRDICAGKPVETIPGLFGRSEKGIESGPDQCRSTLCNMDDLPFPAYDLIDGFPKKYAMPLFSYPKHPNASIISSRGCVYTCSFCDRSVFHNSFRWNSPEYTVDLIDHLTLDYGVKHVMFYDDLFTLNRNRVSRLCELMRKAKRKVTFNCIVRIGHIDSDLIAELKSAGVWMVHVGIESGDQDILDQHKEKLSLDQIRQDVVRLHKAGIWVKGLFMMAFPGETEQSFQKTIDFACSLPLKDANLTAFTPYPGAPIFDGIENLGTFDKSAKNWDNLDCVNVTFVPNEAESKAQLEKQYGRFLSRFYNRPFAIYTYHKMMIESPHSYFRVLKNLPVYMKYLRGLKAK